MKAQRRHELQTNSLSLWIRWKLPEYWEKHGSKVLLVLVFIALGIVLIQWRLEAPKKAEAAAAAQIAAGRQALDQFRGFASSPAEAEEILQHANTAAKLSDRPGILAEADRLKGDYYWELSLHNVDPTTKPSASAIRQREDALNSAQEAFEKVITVQGASPESIGSAYMSLAAIEEQRAWEISRQGGGKPSAEAEKHWDAAKGYYQKVVDSPNMLDLHKTLAKAELAQLEELRKPVWIVAGSDLDMFGPSSRPSTQPAATHPATRSAGATTRPAR